MLKSVRKTFSNTYLAHLKRAKNLSNAILPVKATNVKSIPQNHSVFTESERPLSVAF